MAIDVSCAERASASRPGLLCLGTCQLFAALPRIALRPCGCLGNFGTMGAELSEVALRFPDAILAEEKAVSPEDMAVCRAAGPGLRPHPGRLRSILSSTKVSQALVIPNSLTTVSLARLQLGDLLWHTDGCSTHYWHGLRRKELRRSSRFKSSC